MPLFPARTAPPMLLAALVLAGCASPQASGPYDPVRNVQYSAIGHDPFWMVAIGDDRIVLTLGPAGGRADGALESYAYPRTLPRETNGMRRWESGSERGSLVIEAAPGPCDGAGGLAYEDRVTVILPDRRLSGCGGRPLGTGAA